MSNELLFNVGETVRVHKQGKLLVDEMNKSSRITLIGHGGQMVSGWDGGILKISSIHFQEGWWFISFEGHDFSLNQILLEHPNNTGAYFPENTPMVISSFHV